MTKKEESRIFCVLKMMPNQNSNTNSSRIEGFNKILILLDKQNVEEEVDKKMTKKMQMKFHYYTE